MPSATSCLALPLTPSPRRLLDSLQENGVALASELVRSLSAHSIAVQIEPDCEADVRVPISSDDRVNFEIPRLDQLQNYRSTVHAGVII